MHEEPPRWMNEVSGDVVQAAIEVHKALGPGLLESAYEASLAHELSRRERTVRTQLPLPVVYNDVKLDAGYRIDLIVDDAVIVEVKSVEALAPIHDAPLLTCLRRSGRPLGLLIKLNVVFLKHGIRRLVLSRPQPLRALRYLR